MLLKFVWPMFLLTLGLLFAQEEWNKARHPWYEPGMEGVESPSSLSSVKISPLRDFVRLQYDAQPEDSPLEKKVQMSGWRGERVHGQLAVWSGKEVLQQLSVRCSDLLHSSGAKIRPNASMIRFTKAGKMRWGDVIGRETECRLPAQSVRPIWISVDIPAKTPPGMYTGSVFVRAVGMETVEIPVRLTVEKAGVLPAPKRWKIHLDLWQHPQAVARWHDVEPWSEEHLLLLKPLMKRLADAGQKSITCAIIDEAWNGQTYDFFPSLIRWIRGKDGHMRYDYRHFDTWVEFMMEEVGIREQISCYTMIPWSMKIRYYDEARELHDTLLLEPGKPSFDAIWGAFLSDFRAHVRKKGWLKKTCIALDERPDHMVRAAKALLDKYAPEFRIVSAVDKPTQASQEVYDVAPIITHAGTITPELLAERKAAHRKTTFYVCLHPQKPNTFTASPPAESAWLGLFAAANHLDGFLRWAYNSWNANPLETTDFGSWPSGDCFLVYPGNLSSLRFEYLRDGLEDFEKVQLLRARADKLDTREAREAVETLNAELRRLFTVERSKGSTHEEDVLKARALIRRTASELFSK